MNIGDRLTVELHTTPFCCENCLDVMQPIDKKSPKTGLPQWGLRKPVVKLLLVYCTTFKAEQRSKALAVDNCGARLVVLLLGDPHLLECAQ